MKPPRPRQPEPVTAERIERALDGLARIMVDAGSEGGAYLPIYQRLERELAEMRADDDAMASAMARAARTKGIGPR
ncbi:MAG: hypothetical protein LWW93_11995 [Hyphomicrobiales bacterium]|nr:hypothetical protein [Hyphomicrobiales bacterium]